MNIDCDNEDGTGPSTGVSYNIKMNHNSPSNPATQQSGCVIAGDGNRPSLPTFEGIPVEIRVIIYKYILISDADISIRSASEMRDQIRSYNHIYSLPRGTWHVLSNTYYLARVFNSLPVDCAPQFSLLQNSGILFASRKINEEASQILYANNNFHCSCMRSLPGATVDLLTNLPCPASFSSTQLHFMKHLSLDYCNSRYDHWINEKDIDNCMARNINHISEACPSLKTFSLYTLTRPTLTSRFYKRLCTGQAVLALRNLRNRLDWLNLVSTWSFSAFADIRQTIAPGAVWHCCLLEQSGLPKATITVTDWQTARVQLRWDRVNVFKLDCKKAVEKEEVEFEDAGSEDAGNGAFLADVNQKGNHEINLDTDETHSGLMFGSG